MKKTVVINYAKRLHEKYSLDFPVDLEMIANDYADLKYASIPFEIDGISVNLKKAGVRPTIIVNNERPKKRQRFTLAHEIGHVLIPWHMGTIFDVTDVNSVDGLEYWSMEAEANAFATELLMPSYWVQSLIAEKEDIAELNLDLTERADVSAIAAALRLRSELPPGYVFVVVDKEGTVTYSGSSDGTHVPAASVGEHCDAEKEYTFAESVYKFETAWERFSWIKMPDSMPLPSMEMRPWRDVLEEILDDISDDTSYRNKLKQQLNGVLGHANGMLKKGEFCEEKLFAACVQRLSSKAHLKQIFNHSLFTEFLTSKIKDLVEKEKH